MSVHVTHVYRTYFPDPPGGLQEAIRQIALGTRPFGIRSTIYTLSPSPAPSVLQRPEAEVVRCRAWGSPASCDLGGIQAFTTFAERGRDSDVLHYLFPWPFADVLREAVRPRAPAVMTYISDVVRQRWIGKAYAPLMWRTLRAMKLIVANSPAYARTSPVLSHPDIRHKVRVIPLGIDESSYPVEGDIRILDRLGIGSGRRYFLFLGVLRYYKGLEYLIAAAAAQSLPVVIAGSGPEAARLKLLATRLGADSVIFAGQVSDAEKVALLQQCHALILPSHLRSEAFGMCLVEAAMYGRPLISCEIGTGTSYVNAHEETGLVVPPADPAALASAMTLLAKDVPLARSYGEQARARYERLFAGPVIGKAYAELFSEVAVSSRT